MRGKGEMIKLYYKPKSKWENGGNEIIFKVFSNVDLFTIISPVVSFHLSHRR